MIEAEMTRLMARVFAIYPTLKTWYEELPTKKQTGREWMRALEAVGYPECLEVLDGWTTGKGKAPQGFQREQTVYLLVAQARELADQRQQREKHREAVKVDVAHRRAEYKPLPKFTGTMKAAYDKILTRLPEVRSGEMTSEQWSQWCAEVAKEAV
jgi:hypothetical protein